MPVVLIAGILLYFSRGREPGAALAFGITATGVSGLLLFWKKDVGRVLFFAVFLFGLGISLSYTRTHAIKNEMINRSYAAEEVIGTVMKSEGEKVILAVKGKGNLRTTIKGKPEIGDIVGCTASVFPFSDPALPDGFDFRRKGYFENEAGFAKCADGTVRIFRMGKAPVFEKVRKSISDTFESRISDKRLAAVAESFIIGRQENISREIKDDFRISGIAHILSVSGFHMSLVAFLFFYLARLLLAAVPKISLRYDTRKATAVIAFVMTFFYLQISGKDLPAVRSFIMVAVAYLAILLGKRVFSLQSVAFAALCILIPFPESATQIGFQLSFVSVTALIAGYEAGLFSFIKRSKGLLGKIIRIFGAVLLTDFIATAATLPFIIYHFQMVTPYSMLTNFITNPLFSFISMPFLLVGVLTDIPLVFKGAEIGLGAMVEVSGAIAHLKGADIPVKALPAWGALVAALGFFWITLWKGKRRLLGLPLFFAGMLSGMFLPVPDIILDGKDTLVKENGLLVFETPKRKSFKTMLWLQRFGQREEKVEEAKAKEKRVKCLKYVCFVRLSNGEEIKIQKKEFKNKGTHVIYENSVKVETVKESIGFRPWTRQED